MTHRPAFAFATLLALVLLAGCGEGGKRPGADAAARDATASGPPSEGASGAPHGSPSSGPDAPLPAEFPGLVVTTLDGEPYDLADHRGRWVVVNFWATWCAPCLEEMPELSALHALRGHIDVIGLAYEDTDPDALRAFLDERPVSYPVAIVDTYDPPRDFPTPRGLPLTCLVAPDGRLVRTFLGPVTALELEQAIEAAGGPAPGQGA